MPPSSFWEISAPEIVGFVRLKKESRRCQTLTNRAEFQKPLEGYD
jgi:hypothetical protein